MALLKLHNIVLNCTTFYNLTLKSTTNKSNLWKLANVCYSINRYCSKCNMKVLNVAEKHDAAKSITAYLSRGTSRKVSNYLLYSISFIKCLLILFVYYFLFIVYLFFIFYLLFNYTFYLLFNYTYKCIR